jgi:hypothetical protein
MKILTKVNFFKILSFIINRWENILERLYYYCTLLPVF